MKKEDLRIVFMGTPEFAVETLKTLVDNEYNVVAVVTQPDKPVGRHGSVLQPSEVKVFAQEHDIPVLQPVKMKDEKFVETLRSYNANLQVVVAFRMLPEIVWSIPEYGTFNVHAALLPQYRGAAPINWAIINGETTTGVTTFFLDHEIDTGRIIMSMPFDIPDDADAEYVYNGLMHLGAEVCLKTIDKIIEGDGHVASVSQDDMSNMSSETQLKSAPKIFKETCKINWNQPAKKVYDFVRGLSPYPGAWTNINDNITLKIYKTCKTDIMANGAVGEICTEKNHIYINTADNLLEILELQLSGKKRMSASAFLNGNKDLDGVTAD